MRLRTLDQQEHIQHGQLHTKRKADVHKHAADDVVIYYREVTEGIVPRIRERRRMLRHDGSYAWVYLVISLLRDSDGVPAYHITMIENLSELQALQNQLGQQSVRDMLTGVAN